MPERSKYQGVWQIVAYNRGFYLCTFGVAALVLFASWWLPPTLRLIAVACVVVALLWSALSLAVSHYVYDRSPLYSLAWLTVEPVTCLNIHAGLDEITPLLKQHLPGSYWSVFDIFDAEQMTEPSIARARELNRQQVSQPVSWRKLPAASGSFDAIFVIFAAHELRKPSARQILFTELTRVLRSTGAIIVVEHVRDLPNFLAFGPGFLHFHSRAAWLRTFRSANLSIRKESTVTPFVRVFELVKS